MKTRRFPHPCAAPTHVMGLLALCAGACEGSPDRQEFWRPWYETGAGDPQPDTPQDSGTPPAPLDGGSGPADLAGAMSACGLSVVVTTSAAGGKYAPRNIGAIWISDGSDRFIKTLNVWADRRAKYLKRWNAATSAAMLPANRVDAISSATKSSHGVRTGTWNCKNTAAMPVADGSYKVCFELTDYDGDGPYNCVPFTKSTAPFTLTPADAPSFTARKLELTR